MKVDRYGYFPVLVWVITAIAALNWGTVELLDLNLVTELIPGEFQSVVYIVIGAAGLLDLLETFAGVDLEVF
jgi:uncharacterized membrane protein YuzA (DUF378 family)